eukprot:COSAG01_NODE_1013_length_12138_cov_7.073926_12_plen_149_part_00
MTADGVVLLQPMPPPDFELHANMRLSEARAAQRGFRDDEDDDDEDEEEDEEGEEEEEEGAGSTEGSILAQLTALGERKMAGEVTEEQFMREKQAILTAAAAAAATTTAAMAQNRGEGGGGHPGGARRSESGVWEASNGADVGEGMQEI